MQKTLTITVDEDVYEGLQRFGGPELISHFLNGLAKPHVTQQGLEESYQAMAADEEAEREALEWIEGVIGDVADDPDDS